MYHLFLASDLALQNGVPVVAWPDGPLKVDRKRGIIKREGNPEQGDTRMVLNLDDGRSFVNPSFMYLGAE